jgi:hypothetical protein
MYATRDQKRFFWIPDDQKPAPGPLLLRSITGQRLEVDEASVAAWELPEAEARKIVAEDLAVYAQKLGTFVAGAAETLRAAAAKPVPPPRRPNADATIARSLGITEEELRKDPQKVLGSLQTVLKGFLETLKEGTSDDPAARDRAKERMDILKELVQQQTGDPALAAKAEELPEKIGALLRDPKLEQGILDAAESLRRASEDIRAEIEADRKRRES